MHLQEKLGSEHWWMSQISLSFTTQVPAFWKQSTISVLHSGCQPGAGSAVAPSAVHALWRSLSLPLSATWKPVASLIESLDSHRGTFLSSPAVPPIHGGPALHLGKAPSASERFLLILLPWPWPSAGIAHLRKVLHSRACLHACTQRRPKGKRGGCNVLCGWGSSGFQRSLQPTSSQ